MSTPPGGQRGDAVRNRELILVAARLLVSQAGADTAMEAIAASAGVAVGTLYRHFPTKEALLQAVVTEKTRVLLAELAEAQERVAGGGDAWSELYDLFVTMAHRQAADRAVKAAVARVTAVAEQGIADAERQAASMIEQLMQQAQADGTLRTDVTVMDVAWLLKGLPGADVDDDTRTRCATVVLDGLRAGR